MKKFALLLCVLTVLSSCFIGCNIESPVHAAQKTVEDGDRYKIENNKSVPQFQFYYTSDEYKVGVYYLGRASNVPVAYTTQELNDGRKQRNFAFTHETLNSDNFYYAKANAVSELVSSQVESSYSYSDEKGEYSVPVTASSVVNARFNVETARNSSEYQANAGSYSFENSFKLASDFVTSKPCNILKSVGIFDKKAYYRISLFASCDLYAFAAYDCGKQTISVSYDLSIVPSTLYFGIDRSQNGNFSATNGSKSAFCFTTKAITDKNLFNYSGKYSVRYELNGGAFSISPDSSYSLEGITLPTPSREHYEFGGWCYDSDLRNLATEESILKNPANLTLYAKWNTITDVVTWEGFTALTPAIKNGETGKINTVKVSSDKLNCYIKDGYRADIVFTYVAGVPLEYEGTSDSSILRVQLGFTTDTTDATYVTKNERYYSPLNPGEYKYGTVAFEASLSELLNYYIGARLTVITNDTAIFGISGRDAGSFSELRMEIRYIK